MSTMFRACRHKDLVRLRSLVAQLYKSDPGEYPAEPNIDATFAEFERHPDKGLIVVFEGGGEVIGYAIVVFFWSNEFGGDIAEIDELLVDERSQGRGVAKAFFNWLENTDRKFSGFALQVSPNNSRAIALYESVGFKSCRNQYYVKLTGNRN